MKFTAPSGTGAVGLDVGRPAVCVLNRAERRRATGAPGLRLLRGPGAVLCWTAGGSGRDPASPDSRDPAGASHAGDGPHRRRDRTCVRICARRIRVAGGIRECRAGRRRVGGYDRPRKGSSGRKQDDRRSSTGGQPSRRKKCPPFLPGRGGSSSVSSSSTRPVSTARASGALRIQVPTGFVGPVVPVARDARPARDGPFVRTDP